jgi:hypothetical protein
MQTSVRTLVMLLRSAILKAFRGGNLTLFALREREGGEATITLTEEWNGGLVDGVWMKEVTTWNITIEQVVAKVPDPLRRGQ